MHWDFVFTCFEPITSVTGGIGTYMRLLLRQLGRADPNPPSILFLPNAVVDPEITIDFEINSNVNIEIHYPNQLSSYDHLQNIGDQNAKYSYAVSEHLIALQDRGDTFGVIEVADYGRDGYFLVKRRRFGELRCDAIVVRLHSPELMLFEDNMISLYRLDYSCTEKIEEEVYCYRYADAVLYGGDAMLERVGSLAAAYGVDLKSKAIKIAHPFPTPGHDATIGCKPQLVDHVDRALQGIFEDRRKTTILYSGRLERRKGVLQLVETICCDKALQDRILELEIHFVFCGKDTETSETGGSLLDDMRALLKSTAIADNFVFVGYVEQHVLSRLYIPAADGFIFPSLFENFPNALIETLGHSRPTLVSSRGCMPEIGRPFSHVRSYDPLAPEAANEILGFIDEVKSRPRYPENANYQDHAVSSNARMVSAYLELRDRFSRASSNRVERETKDLSISFIVPNYKCVDYLSDCLKSILRCAKADDELIVVDDGSGAVEAERVRELMLSLGGQFISLGVNKGPSAARNAAARMATRALIQFVDADDLVDYRGVGLCRDILGAHDDIDMVYGFSQTFGRSRHIWAPRDCSVNVFDRNYAPSGIMIRRSVFWEVGGYSDAMRHHYEDWEFNTRFLLLGKRGEMVPRVTIYYRNRADSRTFSNLDVETRSRETVVQFSLQEILGRKDALVDKRFEFLTKAGIYFLNWRRAAAWIDELERKISPETHPPSHAQLASLDRTISELNQKNDALIAERNKLIIENQLLKAQHRLADVINKINHYLNGMPEAARFALFKQSKIFDAAFYLNHHTDLKELGYNIEDSYNHYYLYGWKEGRSPNSIINGQLITNIILSYVGNNPIVNPLLLYEILQRFPLDEFEPAAPVERRESMSLLGIEHGVEPEGETLDA